MNYIEKQVHKFDKLQRRWRSLGFVFGVIKKYGDDQAGNLAALITYYGFLSLFPLLLTITTVLKLIFQGHSNLRIRILNHLSQYVPILGNELQQNVHSLPKTGLSLVLVLLITFYGARGVAGAVRLALNHIWLVPRREVPGFPQSAINNIKIILAGGFGLVLAGFFSTFASSLGHDTIIRLFSSLISLIILFAFLLLVSWLATNKKIPVHNLVLSAAIAAVGLQIVQSIGGYLITHELKHLDSLYGAFAIVLGLVFWIYLQTQVILYTVEIEVVRTFGLWPRGIDNNKPTPADNLAHELYTKRELVS